MEVNKETNVEFIEETHQYLIDGILAPSVSELLSFIFPNKYAGIPRRILEEKAIFGTHIHDAIEKFETGEYFELTGYEEIVFEQYLDLREQYNIEPIEQEIMVNHTDRYAGRLDMIAMVNGTRALVDVKTTAQLDCESLAWQLGLYQLAYGEEFEKCFCIWLPKRELGRLVEIKPKSKAEILEMLKRYEQRDKS